MKNGIIIKIGSNQYLVELENDKIYSCQARGNLKQEALLVGDSVEIEVLDEEKQEGVITKLEERKNLIKRPKMANITQIVCVVSMKLPKPDYALLDKQLIFAQMLGIHPIICLNKVDLVEEKEVEKIKEIYQKIGYDVVTTNAKTGEGVGELKGYFTNQMTAFSGNSGVGKSTLTNEIFGTERSKEGKISQKNQRGKNTTTGVQLYKIGKDTYLADTPGFSTFDISEIPSNELESYFPEFDAFREKCEYKGCMHQKEEHCGIKEAVQEGKIDQGRYERYLKIYEELKQKEARKW